MSNKLVKPNSQIVNRNEEELIINTGTKKYVIKDEHRRPMGEFFWNPSDTGILSRYDDVVTFFNNLDLKEGEDAEKFIVDADKGIVEKMSYLLNEDTSASLFSRVAPLSMLANGNVYAFEVLERIAGLVEKESKIRVNRANTRVNKYTRKYHN